jgi:hypothetical protein
LDDHIGTTTRILRRALYGYRRPDVDSLVDSYRRELAALAESVERLWQDRAQLQDELHETRTRLQAELDRERVLRAEAEQRARAQAARVIADAEEQATAVRHEAHQRVADATDRLQDVLRVRDQLLAEIRGILHAYGDVLERAEGRVPAVAPPPLRAAGDVTAHTLAVASAATASAAPAAPDTTLFPRLVHLDAGPFSDFSELSAFERSLAALPKVEDVYIRTFGDERAVIELTLAEERPLVYDFDRLPYRVTVTSADDDRLTVELAAAS